MSRTKGAFKPHWFAMIGPVVSLPGYGYLLGSNSDRFILAVSVTNEVEFIKQGGAWNCDCFRGACN
jgi:hypothetical protein